MAPAVWLWTERFECDSSWFSDEATHFECGKERAHKAELLEKPGRAERGLVLSE